MYAKLFFKKYVKPIIETFSSTFLSTKTKPNNHAKEVYAYRSADICLMISLQTSAYA